MNTKMFLLTAMISAAIWTLPAEPLPPIACNMKALTAQQRKELGHFGLHVISAITASRELGDGYAFRVDPARASILDVAQWLDVWRRCCPFYEFEIDFHAANASLWLSVKGRPGVKQYILVDVPELAAKLRK